MKLTICRWRNADKYMQARNYDVLISIADPGSGKRGKIRAKHNLLLDFHDVTRDSQRRWSADKVRPNTDHAIAITRFVVNEGIETSHSALIHCGMGRSRAPAAAMIYLMACGMSEHEAVDAVLAVRRKARPNWQLLDSADAWLGSRLLAVCCQRGLIKERIEP